MSRCPGLPLRGRQQRTDRAQPQGTKRGSESAPQGRGSRIADGDAAPFNASATKPPEGFPRLSSQEKPNPFPRNERSHHTEQNHTARTHQISKRPPQASQIRYTVQPAEVAERTVERSGERSKFLDCQPLSLDPMCQTGRRYFDPSPIDHVFRSVRRDNSNAPPAEMDCVLSCAAGQLQNAITCGEAYVHPAINRFSQENSEMRRSESQIIVGCQRIEPG